MIPGNINTALISGAEGGGYQVQRSLRFNSSDSAYLSRTPASAGNRLVWTWAGWVKRSKTGNQRLFTAGPDGTNDSMFQFEGTDNSQLDVWNYQAGTKARKTTAALFRDFSAWYHIVVSCTASTLKIYVNGVEATYSTSVEPDGTNWSFNNTTLHTIGKTAWGSEYFDGYLADVFWIDGQALDPSSFTEVSATTGQLIPKAYTGSFGTNGFWLKFSDNSAATATTLGKDYSGNSNNWTPNNLSVTAGAGNDSLVDTPTSYGTDTGVGGEVRGNYATLNPLDYGSRSTSTFANGNLDVSNSNGSSADSLYRGTIGISSGKWYFETTFTTMYSTEAWVGIAKGSDSFTLKTSSNPYYNGSLVNYLYRANGNKETNSGSATAYGATWTANDVIGVALDLDAGTLTFYKNGSSQGSAFTSITGTWFPCILNGGGNSALVTNFGQRAFAYPVSGFKALVDTNLPTPVVAKPNEVMDVKLYTGNGSTQTISGLGFSPDLVWIKSRSNAGSHAWFDIIRGTNMLASNDTGAESSFGSPPVGGYINTFNSDGFTFANGSVNNTYVNESGYTYVAWTWDAGSSTVTNTQGSITSQVRANASAGFSVVTFTGNGTQNATVGHGLGVAPTLHIIKNRSSSSNWVALTTSINGSLDYAYLNSTAAFGDAAQNAPTSSVFSVWNDTDSNANGSNYVAYCWTPVAGYSSAFSITGNGSTDGSFCHLGFRPRLIIYKRTDTSGDNWFLHDTARDTYNVLTGRLFPNTSGAESTNINVMDVLSNGFKLRTNDTSWNASGGTYVGFAWAESPFAYARAR